MGAKALLPFVVASFFLSSSSNLRAPTRCGARSFPPCRRPRVLELCRGKTPSQKISIPLSHSLKSLATHIQKRIIQVTPSGGEWRASRLMLPPRLPNQHRARRGDIPLGMALCALLPSCTIQRSLVWMVCKSRRFGIIVQRTQPSTFRTSKWNILN